MRGDSIVLGFMLRETNGKCQLDLRLEYPKFLETFKGKITGRLGKHLRNTLCSYLENGKTHTPILFVYRLGGAKRKTNGCPRADADCLLASWLESRSFRKNKLF